MFSKKKVLASFLGIAGIGATAGAIVACGSSSTALNPAGTLTVAVVQGNDVETAAYNAAVNGFKKAYPDITVKTINYSDRQQNLTSWVSANDVPDVLQLNGNDYYGAITTGIVQPIAAANFADSTHANFSGLIDNVFAPMVGKVTGTGLAATYSTSGGTTSASKTIMPTGSTGSNDAITISETTGVNAGFKVYGIPKDFSTLVAHINSDWVASDTTAPAKFDSIGAYVDFIKNSLVKPTTAVSSGKATAKFGLAGELARSIGLLSSVYSGTSTTQTVFDRWKDASATEILANKPLFSADFKKFSEQDYNDFYSIRHDGLAVTSSETDGSWTGAMFDNKVVASVLEGNWYTPTADVLAKTTFAPVANFSGLFYSGWSIATAANDVPEATKFIEYMTYGEGAYLKDSAAGFLSSSTGALQKVVDYFNGLTATDAKKKESFLAHAKAISGATPELFTSVYTKLFDAYNNVVKTTDVKDAANLAAFQVQIDKALTNFYNSLSS